MGIGHVGSAVAEDKPLTIGVSHLSLGFPYAVALQKGEMKAAKELGVQTVELDAHANPLNQANDIDKLIAQHVDGIIMVPIDSIAAQDWADKAKAANIPSSRWRCSSVTPGSINRPGSIRLCWLMRIATTSTKPMR